MGSNVIINIILPASLGVIMFGMGTSLVVDDFKRILAYPKAVLIGTFGQILLLPILGLLFCLMFDMSPETAVGIMILTACAGGAISNLIVYLARGDVALSVTLTGISCVVTVFTIPFIVNYSLHHFLGATSASLLPIGETNIRLFLITLLPVCLGMALRHAYSGIGARLEKPMNRLATLLFIGVFIGVIMKEKDRLASLFFDVGPIVICLNLVAMALGIMLAKAFKLNQEQSISIGVEIGLQNSVTGIFIAATLLGSMALAAVPAVYSIVMLFNAGLFILLTRIRARNTDPNLHAPASVVPPS